MDSSERDISIYICNFSARVDTANVLIKFPCQYFLEWKTANGKKVVESKARPTARNSLVEFNETLELATEMIFDNSSGRFLRKETLLNLNLISKSRQDQVKLIGRVAIDLADIANRQDYQQSKPYKLSYCSVDAELTFSAALDAKRLTNMNPQDLDKSSFNDYFSFYSCASSPKERARRELANTEAEETSIGYTKLGEHAIDLPFNEQRHSRPFNQTFFMFSSPKITRTRETSKNLRETQNQSERASNIRSEFAVRSPSGNKDINNSRSTQLTQLPPGRAKVEEVRAQEQQSNWEKEKQRFRGEIDGNRQKIDELERKIIQLSTNLEDSKRHLEFTERQNREKEEIIKILKQNELREGEGKKQEEKVSQSLHMREYSQLQQKLEKVGRERESAQRQWRSKEDMYKEQIKQFQCSTDLLRKETDEFRSIWQEKKEHYEQKITTADNKLREKQAKVVELNTKVEDLLKFKYQYEILKELNDEKDEKLKTAEKSLNKLKFEIEQINKNNYAEEIYKLKLQLAQSTKAHEDLLIKHSKNEEEINRYRENYIKIETAYEIQGKNYDSCKDKNNQNETLIYNLQKDNFQLKNSLNNSARALEELNLKLSNAHHEQTLQQKSYQQLQREQKKLICELEVNTREKQELRSVTERLRLEQEAKSKDFEQKIGKIESTIIAAQQQKERQLKEEQMKLSSAISQLQAHRQQLQEVISNLEHSLSDLKNSSEADAKNKEATIANLESVIADKQEIIKMSNKELQTLRECNSQLTDTLREMSVKEKQLEENITILEEESHKILYILEQKEQVDKELEQIHQKLQNALQANDALSQTIQEQAQHIDESFRVIQRKDQVINENKSSIQEANMKMAKYSDAILTLQQELSQKEVILHSKSQEAHAIEGQLQHVKSAMRCAHEELSQSREECSKLREIIKEINERYEEHLKLEEKYHLELSAVRQEKEELQLYISKNNNQFAHYNEELQSKVSILQKEIDRLEQELSFGEEERKHFEQKCVTLQTEKRTLYVQLEDLKMETLRMERESNETINNLRVRLNDFEQARIKDEQASSTVERLHLIIEQLQAELANEKGANGSLQQQLQEHRSSLHLIQSERNNLHEHIEHLQQQMQREGEAKQETYNELISMDEEIEMQAAQSILEQRKIIDQQKYDQVAEQLSEKEEKVKALEEKIEQLNLEIRNLVYELQKKNTNALYEDFPQFHREEMAKIIEEQRKEIDRLEAENKLKLSKTSTVLENRIRQLQTNIVELQSSFRMEIDRILNGHSNKDTENGLSVINEEMMEDETLKSEKSLASVIATPNRVKQSIDSAQAFEYKEKLIALQEEKQHLESLLDASEEEKFNLMSTINEKQIVLEEALRTKMMVEMEIDDLRKINEAAHSQLHSLQAEVESLRNQVNFGTSIVLNDQSVTRSEPIITSEQVNEIQNKDIEIENLRTEVERCKSRQEELVWNIRDLEMQLETVTESLNLLNGSSMNSFLNSSAKLSSQEEQPPNTLNADTDYGYSKERLLQSLKRNEELKEMAHNIIRALKQRERQAEEQQRLLRDLNSNRAIINTAISNRNTHKLDVICKKVPSLCKDFQTIKTQVVKQNIPKQDNSLKCLLAFEQKLKELRLLSEREDPISVEY